MIQLKIGKCVVCYKEWSSDTYYARNNKQKTCSIACRNRLIAKEDTPFRSKRMKGKRLGNLHPNWKGENIGYSALHYWARNQLSPKPKICPVCNLTKKTEITNVSKRYKRDIEDWKWMCRKCHMKEDGRIDGHTGGSKKNLAIWYSFRREV